MSQSYEESFGQTLWHFLPGITKFLSIIGLISVIFLGLQISASGPAGAQYVFPSNLERGYNSTVGSKDAKLHFIYFVDYECPACAGNRDTMSKIKTEYQDKVYFVYKNNPLPIHVNSVQAAQAVQAAGRQGKYFEYGDQVFQSQDKGLTGTTLENIAKDLGLDVQKWNQDRHSDEIAKQVSDDQKDLSTIELPKSSRDGQSKASGDGSGTPTNVVFKDGKVVDWWVGGSTVTDLENHLNDLLK